MKEPIKIAMWSGPRNISTTLMRSFSSRNDTSVIDEPFYAYFLKQTQIKHPEYKEIIKLYEYKYERIVSHLTGDNPDDSLIWYQKQMAQHKLPGDNIDWIKDVTNCFLIRDPMKVINSYSKIYDNITVELLGFPQINEIFQYAKNLNQAIPIVINTDSILKNPEKALQALCNKLNISYQSKMLRWDSGIHKNDGIWGKYWYKNVEKTSSFSKPSESNENFPDKFSSLLEKCNEYYKQIEKYKITND